MTSTYRRRNTRDADDIPRVLSCEWIFGAGAAGRRWTTIDVRDGEKGPLMVEAVKRRSRRERRPEALDRTNCCSSLENVRRMERTSWIIIFPSDR